MKLALCLNGDKRVHNSLYYLAKTIYETPKLTLQNPLNPPPPFKKKPSPVPVDLTNRDNRPSRQGKPERPRGGPSVPVRGPTGTKGFGH